MNKDNLGGKMDQVTGKVKEKVGETIGNDRMANEGVADQVKGAAKETWGNAKDAVHESADMHRRETTDRATDARETLTDKVQNVKNKVNDSIEEQRAKDRLKHSA